MTNENLGFYSIRDWICQNQNFFCITKLEELDHICTIPGFAIYINIVHHFELLTGSLLPLYGSLHLAVLGLKCYLVSFYFEKLLPIL